MKLTCDRTPRPLDNTLKASIKYWSNMKPTLLSRNVLSSVHKLMKVKFTQDNKMPVCGRLLQSCKSQYILIK